MRTERLACSVLRLRSIFSFLFLGSIFFFFVCISALLDNGPVGTMLFCPPPHKASRVTAVPPSAFNARLSHRELGWRIHGVWRGLSTAYDAGFKFVRPSCCPLQLLLLL